MERYQPRSSRFIQNKYYRWYLLIIAKPDSTGYTEKHHKIPVAMGGNNRKANLVRLSARKHFLVHWLLTKCVDGPENRLMLHAFGCMARNPSGGRKLTSWQYALVKKAYSQARKGQPSPNKGNKYSPERCAAMSVIRKNVPHTKEHNQKISKGMLLVADKIAAKNRGKKHTEEHIRKSTAHSKGNKYRLGYKEPPEIKAKISVSLIGNTRKLGYKDSPETRAKKSKSKIGNRNRCGTYPTEETLRLISIGQKAAWVRRKARMRASRDNAELLK